MHIPAVILAILIGGAAKGHRAVEAGERRRQQRETSLPH